ncbi:hypothetical protein FRC17_008249 [Serendipita sp. 399]|nr:hypothetical protein FRC17_008249 [Serendipita sp. 399]
MGTGTKCLPVAKYSNVGDTVHDLHGEVVARRAAVRWFLCEMARSSSEWLEQIVDQDTKATLFRLKPGVKLHMYISELPCNAAFGGAASMNTLGYLQTLRDPKMAALKRTNDLDASPRYSEGVARDRNGYQLIDVVRTKPGRGDSPRTNAMSCSDKIALWSVIGIQGALAVSLGLQPIHIDMITIGSVKGVDLLESREELIYQDCLRAFFGRLERCSSHGLATLSTSLIHQKADTTSDYEVHRPNIVFTSTAFDGGRDVAAQNEKSSSNEALCWVADEDDGIAKEILVNGTRRGVLPKDRSRPSSSASLLPSSLPLTALTAITVPCDTLETARVANLEEGEEEQHPISGVGWRSYFEAKHGPGTQRYHEVKSNLRGMGGASTGLGNL